MPKKNSRFYIGIDIGGTKICAGLVSPSGIILEREKIPTPVESSSRRSLLAIVEIIQNLLTDRRLTTKEIRGIGIGIPGLVNAGKGEVLVTPNMNLTGINIIRELRHKFPVQIVIGNDANLGILGEKWLGAACGAENAVGLFLGTGLGGGVISGGKLLTGYQGVAAEIGHLIVDPHGPRCSCGNRGCLEAFVGRWAIERDIREAINDGKKPKLHKLFKKKINRIKSKVLREALDKKDPVVTPIMKKSAEILGLACISLRHIFDPECIILGGGVIEACRDYIIPVVKKTIEKDKFFRSMRRCKIKKSSLGDDAVLLGSVALVRQSEGKEV
ncbi:MAG: ROK family protein [Candidatus Omnitrophica bacterium]|nr:ROK family protein [Candidatus Omnitrophota bacterium]